MPSHTYRMVEIVGTSTQGVDDAITNGIARANRTLRNLDWFQVTEIRGQLQEGQIAEWQITMKVGFRLEE